MKKFNKYIHLKAMALILGSSCGFTVDSTVQAADHASLFIRYQYDVQEVLQLLNQAQGKPLDPQSTAARWLDEMGWRRWVRAAQNQAFQLTPAMREQLLAQDRLLSESFAYRKGDAVWVPAESTEKPYGFDRANVNPRGKILEILKADKATYFVVEVGVDNGGMETQPGKYYDGRTGPVMNYGPNFRTEAKTYVYSMEEIQRYNAPFRSTLVSSDTGTQVDYVKDQKWLDKISAFKDHVIQNNLEIDFTKSPTAIYTAQKRLIKAIFSFFKMNRNAPGGGPLLGDVAAGGGNCFTQACVLSHAVHAIGEPYGLRAINISGSTVNPVGGHGFVRLMIRGPEETHVFDSKIDPKTGKPIPGHGIEIRANTINYISDPGWADFGVTPDFFAMTPIEDAINPNPVDANRAIYDILQGDSFDKVVAEYGKKGAFVSEIEFRDEMFRGSAAAEFLAPKAQIPEAVTLENTLKNDLQSLLDETKTLKANTANTRSLKTRILTDIVEKQAGRLKVPGWSAENLKVLLTEYLFRAVK